MSVSLVRIDDRLVHGQVVEGWLKSLRINHIIVASDAVAADETQKALYLLAVPYGVGLSCLTIEASARAWVKGEWNSEKALVLVSSPVDALRLLEAGAPLQSVNVGGLHYKEGRVQVLKAVSLNDEDVQSLRRLAQQGVALEARPLPLDEPIEMTSYIERWQHDHSGFGDTPR